MITKIKFAIETVGVHVLKLIKYSHHSIIRPVRQAELAVLAISDGFELKFSGSSELEL